MRKLSTLLLMLVFLNLMWSHSYANGNPDLHAGWDTILKQYVSDGKMDYHKLLSTPSDLEILNTYLSALNTADVSVMSEDETMAFWINAYNAFTVKLILNHYPVNSIKEIKNPWKKKKWLAGGQTLSLDDIEHIKLRQGFNDPRIHFAIVCASIGCPALYPQAFKAETLDSMLDHVSRRFFSMHKNFRLKKKDNETIVYLNRIFKWFKRDFAQNQKQLVDFILTYVEKKDRDILNASSVIVIKYLDYDWSLNNK